MLLQCDIQVNNRLVPPQNVRGPSKCSRGAVELFRKAGKETTKEKTYTVVVYTNKAKSGVKYRVRGRPFISVMLCSFKNILSPFFASSCYNFMGFNLKS